MGVVVPLYDIYSPCCLSLPDGFLAREVFPPLDRHIDDQPSAKPSTEPPNDASRPAPGHPARPVATGSPTPTVILCPRVRTGCGGVDLQSHAQRRWACCSYGHPHLLAKTNNGRSSTTPRAASLQPLDLHTLLRRPGAGGRKRRRSWGGARFVATQRCPSWMFCRHCYQRHHVSCSSGCPLPGTHLGGAPGGSANSVHNSVGLRRQTFVCGDNRDISVASKDTRVGTSPTSASATMRQSISPL